MKVLGGRRLGLLLVLPALSALLAASGVQTAEGGLRVDPGSIHMGAFFSGESIRVAGEIPAGSRAIVEVIGKRLEEELLRKGQHWDVWMSVGEIDIENAPCLYLASSTGPDDLSSPGADAQFGYAALKKQVNFTGAVKGMERAEIFKEFIALKEGEKLYGEWPGELKVSGEHEGIATIEGSFRIPSRVAPGDYLVRLSVVDHGRVLQTQSTGLSIRMTGLPAFLDSLAEKHGALYGLFAVAIAVAFGFLVGLAFKKVRSR